MKYILTISFLFIPFASNAFTLNGSFKHGWRGPKLSYNINTSNCPSNLIAALEDAIELINSVSTSFLEIEKGSTNSTTTPANLYGGTATDSPTIVCDTNFNTTTGGDEDAVAGVGFISTGGGNRVLYGGVILNASAGAASVNNLSKTTLAIVIAHEMMHSLGFGHSEDEAALMYYNASYKEELRFSQDDWDALTYLYPRDEFGDDDLMGCGRVGSAGAPPTNLLLIMLLPFMLYICLRFTPKFNNYKL